jgi:hypothetical protein
MKPKQALWILLGLHVVLLLLASTQFTVLSWMWSERSWTFNYFSYCWRDGWGYQYKSDYDLTVVLAYIAAHLLGLGTYYVIACKYARVRGTFPALILCLVGLASFSIEASHWLWSHHLSCIASCPLGSLFLAIVVAFQIRKASLSCDELTGNIMVAEQQD